MSLKSTNSNLSKEKFREISLEKLKRAADKKRLKNSHTVIKSLEKILKSLKFKTIALYMPLKIEIDMRKIFSKLRRNKTIYVPFMECVSFKLVKYRLPVWKKKFNIFEPANSCGFRHKVDIIVVPVIGVDGDLRRVGFGKGMYDKFFAALKPQPLTIFVQLVKCYTEVKLCEAYDVQADIYITPTDIMTRRGKNGFRNRNRNICCRCNRSGRIYNSKKT
ncbi:MAG: 5-formyltetrahydrofolate cyclo-ligase [Campylobacteraceae bacterium]|jgi:5-formyltetrahydrofolate cyclo-ligase|nr:5-formyltetrahydrofolate cyclo-ligase [Campylobacteraceae bacterium]